MGDRRNVILTEDASYKEGGKQVERQEQVALYSHWGGTELPAVVQRALRRRQRWNDLPYLARIIFSEMVRGDINGETGFGISGVVVCEESGRDIVIDVGKQSIKLGRNRPPMSLEDFLEIDLGKEEDDG